MSLFRFIILFHCRPGPVQKVRQERQCLTSQRAILWKKAPRGMDYLILLGFSWLPSVQKGAEPKPRTFLFLVEKLRKAKRRETSKKRRARTEDPFQSSVFKRQTQKTKRRPHNPASRWCEPSDRLQTNLQSSFGNKIEDISTDKRF